MCLVPMERRFDHLACGLGYGQFDGPYGIAVDNEGNFLVADCWNHRIQKLTAVIAAVGSGGNGLPQLPYGITFNASNNKVIQIITKFRC